MDQGRAFRSKINGKRYKEIIDPLATCMGCAFKDPYDEHCAIFEDCVERNSYFVEIKEEVKGCQ